jgi:hypothetical protein
VDLPQDWVQSWDSFGIVMISSSGSVARQSCEIIETLDEKVTIFIRARCCILLVPVGRQDQSSRLTCQRAKLRESYSCRGTRATYRARSVFSACLNLELSYDGVDLTEVTLQYSISAASILKILARLLCVAGRT